MLMLWAEGRGCDESRCGGFERHGGERIRMEMGQRSLIGIRADGLIDWIAGAEV